MGGALKSREWLENRLEELAEIFAVAVGGFAVMHNHLHVLLRLESRRNWLGSSSGWVLLPNAESRMHITHIFMTT